MLLVPTPVYNRVDSIDDLCNVGTNLGDLLDPIHRSLSHLVLHHLWRETLLLSSAGHQEGNCVAVHGLQHNGLLLLVGKLVTLNSVDVVVSIFFCVRHNPKLYLSEPDFF